MRKQALLINGKWIDSDQSITVLNKYTQQPIAEAAIADGDAINHAVEAAAAAAPIMAKMPTHQRAAILRKTADLIAAHKDELGRTIAEEAGKAIKYSNAEVDRAVDTFTLAGEEAKRIHGETLPMDAVASGEGYFGYWQRRPVGVVAAITPFNFPLNLVAHKVAPAIAAGNTVVLKPASTTPLSAGLLCELLLEAGLPEGAINLIHGSGSTVGDPLVSHPKVAKVTFTGSVPVGEHITRKAGIKKVTLELGNNAPVIVAPDADLDMVAKRCAFGAFYNSGQVCISVQRIYADPSIEDALCEALTTASNAMTVGDPLKADVEVGPLIQPEEVDRITGWVDEAVAGGATVLTGHQSEGAIYMPTILRNTSEQMRVMCDETFAPVASVVKYDSFASALKAADATGYGLQASVFTRDIDRALKAVDNLNFGGVMINEVPAFRLDHMPYGGNRNSGLGREGVRFAVEEMTNIQMVAIKRSSN